MNFLRGITMNLLIIASILNPAFATEEGSNKGKIFANAGFLTNWYYLDSEDFRKELPNNVTQFLSDRTLTGRESDVLNYSIGLGYYFDDDLTIMVDFANDISIGDFSNIIRNIFSSYNFKTDIDIYSLDIQKRLIKFNEDIYLYAKLGLNHHRVKARVFDYDDFERTEVAKHTFNDTSLKLGLGVQWDFSRHFSVKAGYSHSDFLSMDKSYINMEYRF